MHSEPPILLVEDNNDHAELILGALARAGARCHRLPNGDELSHYLMARSSPPQLILLDLKMPGRSGHEVLKWLRETPDTRAIPAVVLTTSEARGDQEKALLAGASGFEVKPSGLEPLRELAARLVRRWLVPNIDGPIIHVITSDPDVVQLAREAAALIDPKATVGILKTASELTGGSRDILVWHRSADDDVKTVVQMAEAPLVVITEEASAALIGEGVDEVLPRIGCTASWLAQCMRHAQERVRLTKLVEERTADLEAFASHAAHDLKAPARRMSQFGELFAANPTGENAETCLHYMMEAATTMTCLVRDLLVFAQSSAHESLTEVEASSCLEESLAQLAGPLEEVKPIVRIADLPSVVGSHRALVQVFQNLVENALTYRDPGRALIIEIGSRLRPDSGVTLTVSDNGRGIKRSDAKRVLQPLQRAASDVPGTGLGLAIVTRAMRSMGGTLRMASEVGVGTTFLLDFPPMADE